MAFKKVQESKQIGTYMAEGQEIPIIQPEVHVEIKNKKTGNDYNSEDHAKSDVDNPETDTTESDVEKSVEIREHSE